MEVVAYRQAQQRGFGADGEFPVPVAGLLQPIDRAEGGVAPITSGGYLGVLLRCLFPNHARVVEDELLDGEAAVATIGPVVLVAAHEPVDGLNVQRTQVECEAGHFK